MSEQEKTGGENVPVVMVEQTASSRHKPYRPTELQEEANADLHKRPRAPAVPSVKEELKDTTAKEVTGTTEHIESERAVMSERQSHPSKKLSSTKRKGSPPEDIAMVLLDAQKENITTVPQPIPDHDTVMTKGTSLKQSEKSAREKEVDDDSITEEIAELRTNEPAKEHSEWSDDEEAGGLPRSESRGSRVSRAVRQLFCCGVTYSPPSEEDIPPRQFSGI